MYIIFQGFFVELSTKYLSVCFRYLSSIEKILSMQLSLFSTSQFLAHKTESCVIMQQFAVSISFWTKGKWGHYELFCSMRGVLGRMFLTVFTCACSSPMLFSPLTEHHAEGWRSRLRQQIRGTQERRENRGGRGGRTPWPQSTMSYLVLCPPCCYLLHMDVETVHSCLLPTEMKISVYGFVQMNLLHQWHSKSQSSPRK